MSLLPTTDALIFSGDPGAANFVRYLPHILKDTCGLRACLTASQDSLAFLRGQGVDAEPWPDKPAAEVLHESGAQLLLTGTSADHRSANLDLIAAARDAQIPSVGAIDAMMSAPLRFRGNTDDALRYAPDWLLLSNEEARAPYLALGYPEARTVVSGHPHHEAILETARAHLETARAARIRRAFGEVDPTLSTILFVTEPEIPRENLSPPVGQITGWDGSNERTHVALQSVIDTLEKIGQPHNLITQLHPRNTEAQFTRYRHQTAAILHCPDPILAVCAADLVIGLTSSLVIESAVVNRPTVSVVTNAADAGELPALVDSRIIRVQTPDALQVAILDGLSSEPRHARSPDGMPASQMLIAKTLSSIFPSPGLGRAEQQHG